MNSTLTFHRWLGGDGWWFLFVPAGETLIIAWAVLGVGWIGRTGRRIILTTLGSLYGSLVIYSLTEFVVQHIYGRPFFPQADIPMIRGVLLLLFGQIGSLVEILTPLSVVLILLVFWGFGIATLSLGRIVASVLTKKLLPLSGIMTLAGILLLVMVSPPTILTTTIASGIAAGRPVVFDDVLLRSRVEDEQPLPASLTSPEETLEDTQVYTFPGILDRDIYVFVIEAYGYAAHSRDDLYTQLEPDFQKLQDVLAEADYGVVSNYLLSPVAGGFSWLAETTFLTGQWINSQPVFLQLYDSPVSTLPGFLYDGGYYTFTVKPGTVHGSWPEGWDLFRFKESMIAYDGDFDYRGPLFSYVHVTDQFAVHTANQRLEQIRSVEGEGQPLFAYYQLVSSHTPFNRIPPYLEDWNDLGDGSIYNELSDQILTYNNTWTGGSQLDEGFVASLSYVFTVLSGYIEHFIDHSTNPIIIIFGDHQPQRPIREQNAHLSVPIHVASRDPQILRQFKNIGYSQGLRGEQAPPHQRMSEFFSLFVDVATNALVNRQKDTEVVQ